MEGDSGIMFGRKLVFMSEMYSPRAHIRWGSVSIRASCLREETSFSRWFGTLERVGQVRMACWNDSGSVPQRGQDVLEFSSNEEGWGGPGSFCWLAFGESSLRQISRSP